jgi:hypothetical protein
VVGYLERPMLHVTLDGRVIKLSTNQSLSIENGVCWVDGYLILSSISDQSFGVGKCYVGGRSSVTLVICDDFNLAMLKYTNAKRIKMMYLKHVGNVDL